MSSPILPPYEAPFKPVPQVTPLTYRDGVTMLKKLDDLKKYINRVIVPFVNDNFSELADEFEAQVNILIAQVNAALDAQSADVDQKISDLETYVNEQIALIIGSSVEVQDDVVAAIFTNPTSDSRIVTDALYAEKAVETDVSALNTLTEIGRLSESALDTRFDEKADNAATSVAIDTLNDRVDITDARVDTAETDIDSLEVTVNTGRLSDNTINGRFDEVNANSVVNRLGGFRGDTRFQALHDAISIPTTIDYRVCVLGSSSANGAYTTEPEKAVFARLAYRCGVTTYPDMDLVAAPVGGVGLRWWNGCEGNTTSATYFNATRRTALNYVQPDLVIHMIGENDYYYGTSISEYITNMESACAYIEANSPGSINVLVHSHGRNDVPSPVASWNAYRDALQAVANNNPSRRYFIDTMEYFYPLGTMNSSLSGMGMLFDTVHPNDAGHRYLAKIIGAHLGIPDESDFANFEQVWKYPFATVATDYTVSGAVIGGTGITLPDVGYPREIVVEGSVWIGTTNTAAYMNVTITNAANGTPIQSVSHSVGGTTNPKSLVIADRLYVPPKIRPGVLLQIFNPGTATVQPDAGGVNSLSRVRIASVPV